MISLTVRQTIVLIVVFLITCAGLIALDQQHRLDGAKSPAEQLISPFEAALSRAAGTIHGLRGGAQSDVHQQLEQVTAERDHLLAENARLTGLENQIAELQRQLGFKQAHPELQAISANVVGADPNGTARMIVIDRGTNDGIQVGMAVISPDFFVGQVSNVTQDRAKVTLAIDASSRVGAMLQSNNASGVVFGEWQSGGAMQLRDLDPTVTVNEGDVIVTSGQTARVPKGLVIGKVGQIERNVQAAQLNVEVASLVNFSRIQSVMVILDDGSTR